MSSTNGDFLRKITKNRGDSACFNQFLLVEKAIFRGLLAENLQVAIQADISQFVQAKLLKRLLYPGVNPFLHLLVIL